MKTTSGAVELERPRVRDARALGFESKVLGKSVARTHALESLVICSFLRGLSVRDVEAALAETFEEPVISKSTVARVCRDTAERYRRWCARCLEEHDLVYLFLDATYLKPRLGDEPAEGVPVAWGVTLEGRKVLLGLALGSRESYESWLSFGRGMNERGLRSPALVVADGAPGFWKAACELWPSADEQRCTVHALPSVTAKLPERHHREVKARCGGSSRGRLAGRGKARAARARRRLPRGLPLRRGGDRAGSGRPRRPPALALRAPQASQGARTCSSAHSSRSAGAPEVIGRFPARPRRCR